MWGTIAAVATAITAICGILTLVYKYYLSPKVRASRKADAEFDEANKKGDVGGLY